MKRLQVNVQGESNEGVITTTSLYCRRRLNGLSPSWAPSSFPRLNSALLKPACAVTGVYSSVSIPTVTKCGLWVSQVASIQNIVP